MKWILILWLTTGAALSNKTNEQGGLTTATFDDDQACMTALEFVTQQSSNRVGGVCVPSSSKE
jgi:hypothetical protein